MTGEPGMTTTSGSTYRGPREESCLAARGGRFLPHLSMYEIIIIKGSPTTTFHCHHPCPILSTPSASPSLISPPRHRRPATGYAGELRWHCGRQTWACFLAARTISAPIQLQPGGRIYRVGPLSCAQQMARPIATLARDPVRLIGGEVA